MYLAELNIGRLVAPPDDPRVAEFMQNLDRVNGIGKRSPGFVWMMEGSGAPGTGNTENNIGDDPQLVANLTVWQDRARLEAFVHKTIHARFMARKGEWFEALTDRHFVMWHVAPDHRPSLEEALDRLAHLKTHGPSEYAFGWEPF